MRKNSELSTEIHSYGVKPHKNGVFPHILWGYRSLQVGQNLMTVFFLIDKILKYQGLNTIRCSVILF